MTWDEDTLKNFNVLRDRFGITAAELRKFGAETDIYGQAQMDQKAQLAARKALEAREAQ